MFVRDALIIGRLLNAAAIALSVHSNVCFTVRFVYIFFSLVQVLYTYVTLWAHSVFVLVILYVRRVADLNAK